MPTYQYACTECDHRFEAVQAFSDASLTTCPECNGKLRKVYGSVGVVFKGSGFYRTDSRSGSSATDTSSGASSSSDSKSSESSKPAAKESTSSSSNSTASTPAASSSSSSSSTKAASTSS
ncbi:FmdB family zinc ribbon protein [Nakamurella leprariae]|uniref:FmdB family transcriptional regulator n=1 Tax=Nakamurella leprariae TaxID=2803911 RepID=A0A939C1T5_9ACTN|nr:FmdB family zinc ribbon protein [Nakamurella leprariae]MBM9467457.1 FmdB family transcriptional regulator [Nakamurella leprariae]